MSAVEFDEWIAFDGLEPIGDRRADVLAGVLGALVGNQWRGKDSQPLTPETVLRSLPWWNEGAGQGDAPAAHWTVTAVEEMWAAMSEEDSSLHSE